MAQAYAPPIISMPKVEKIKVIAPKVERPKISSPKVKYVNIEGVNNDFAHRLYRKHKVYEANSEYRHRKYMEQQAKREAEYAEKERIKQQEAAQRAIGRSVYSDPNQINSVRDVITRTIDDTITKWNSGGILDKAKAIADVDDTAFDYAGKYFKQTVIDPITSGNTDALPMNLYVDVMETLDLVDGAFKAYEIERANDGKRKSNKEEPAQTFLGSWKQDMSNMFKGSHEAGMEGVQRWLRGENYDFETGKFGYDLSREILQPGIISSLAKGAVKSVASGAVKGFKEIGDKTAKRVIMRNLDDGLEPALKSALNHGRVSPAAKSIIREQGEELFKSDLKKLKFIQATDKVGKVINAVDDAPARIVWNFQVAPVKYAIKFGWNGVGKKAANYSMKALGRTVERYMPKQTESVISFVNKVASPYGEKITTIAGALDRMDQGLPFSTVRDKVSEISVREMETLQSLKSYVYNINELDEVADLVNTKISDKFNNNVYSTLVNTAKADKSREALDNFAKTVLGEDNTFKDYISSLSRAQDVVEYSNPALENLIALAKNLDEHVSGYQHYNLINKVSGELNDVTESMNEALAITVSEEMGLLHDELSGVRRAIDDAFKENLDTVRRQKPGDIEAVENLLKDEHKIKSRYLLGAEPVKDPRITREIRNLEKELKSFNIEVQEFASTVHPDDIAEIERLSASLNKYKREARQLPADEIRNYRIRNISKQLNELKEKSMKKNRDIFMEANKARVDRMSERLEELYKVKETGQDVVHLNIPQVQNAVKNVHTRVQEYLDSSIAELEKLKYRVQDAPHIVHGIDEAIKSYKEYHINAFEYFLEDFDNASNQLAADLMRLSGDVQDAIQKHINIFEKDFDNHIADLSKRLMPDFTGTRDKIVDVIRDQMYRSQNAETPYDTIVMNKSYNEIINGLDSSELVDKEAFLDAMVTIRSEMEEMYHSIQGILLREKYADVKDYQEAMRNVEGILEALEVPESLLEGSKSPKEISKAITYHVVSNRESLTQLSEKLSDLRSKAAAYIEPDLPMSMDAIKQIEDLSENYFKRLASDNAEIDALIKIKNMQDIKKYKDALDITSSHLDNTYNKNIIDVLNERLGLDRLETLHDEEAIIKRLNEFISNPNNKELFKRASSMIDGQLANIRKTNEEVLKQGGVFKADTVIEYVNELINLSDRVIEESAQVYLEEQTKLYKLTLSNIVQWFMLHDNADVAEVLKMASYNDFTQDAGMQVIEGLAQINGGDFNKLLLSNRNFEAGAIDAEGFMFEVNRLLPEIKETHPAKISQRLRRIEDLSDDAKLVMETIHGLASMNTMMGDLKNVVPDEELQAKFLDALQSMYNMDKSMSRVFGSSTSLDTEYMKDKVMEQVNTLLSMDHNMRSFKLENAQAYLKRMYREGKISGDDIKEFVEAYADDAAHMALADAEASILVKHRMIGHKPVPGIDEIGIDLETNSANKHVAKVNQIGVYDQRTGQRYLIVRTDAKYQDYPDNDALYTKLYNVETVEEGRELFERVHVHGDVNALKENLDIADNVEIIAANSDEAMAEKFYEVVMQYSTRKDAKKLFVMQNGLDYDLDIINRLMRNKTDKTYRISATEVYDTLVEMKKKYNIRTLAHDEEEALRGVLDRYVAQRTQELVDSSTLKSFDNVVRNKRSNQLVPTMSVNFNAALKRIMESVDDNSLLDTLKSLRGDDLMDALKEYNEGDVFGLVRRSFSGFRDVFTTRKYAEQFFNRFTIDAGDIKNIDIHRRISEELENLPPELRNDENIMTFVYGFAENLGLSQPYLTAKKVIDSENLSKWFDVEYNKSYAEDVLELYNKEVKQMDKLLDAVKINHILDNEISVRELQQAREQLLKAMNPGSMFHLLKEPNNAATLYVQVARMYRSLAKGVRKSFSDKTLQLAVESTMSEQVLRYVKEPRLATKFMITDDTAAKFHRLGLTKDQEVIYDSLNTQVHLDLYGLDKLINSKGFDRVVKRMYPTYRKILQASSTIRDGVDGYISAVKNTHLHDVRERLSRIYRLPANRIDDTMVDAFLRKHYYNHGRIYLESLGDSIAYSKLKSFLELEPKEVASYMWNYSKGHVIIDNDSLLSSAFFKNRRNGILKKNLFKGEDLTDAYLKLTNNPELAELGIKVERSGEFTHMYLDPAGVEFYENLDVIDLPRVEVHEDVLKGDVFKNDKDIIEKDLLDKIYLSAIEDNLNVIDEIATLSHDSIGSTLEVLDYKGMDQVLKGIGAEGKGIQVDDLHRLGMLNSSNFNHTVLGRIDGRRKLMPYASYNPLKTSHNSARMLHNMNDARHQYFNYLFDENSTLEYLTQNMSDDEVLNFFKDNREYTLAWAKAVDNNDFEVKRFLIKDKDDIAKAKKFGAVVLDEGTYTKMYQTLNNNKMPKFLSALNKHLVVPWKVSVLAYRLGTAFRNIVDSNLKNFVTVNGDPAIMGSGIEAAKHLYQYKQAMVEIKKVYGIMGGNNFDDAIDRAFKSGKVKMDREVFDFVNEFKHNITSSGIVSDILHTFDDQITTLYKSNQLGKAGISEGQFRTFLSLTDGETSTWLARNIGKEEHYNFLMKTRKEFRDYKKASAVLENYKGHYLNHDLVVDLIRNPDKIDLALAQYPEELAYLKKNINNSAKINTRKSISSRVRNSFLVRHSLTAMGISEEHARYSLYLYLKNKGESLSKIAYEIKRTHFDYDNKTAKEKMLEMFFPFITFKKNSLMYWFDEMESNPKILRHFGNYMTSQTDWNSYEADDFYWQKGLYYALLAGNPVVDRDTGLYLKLQPSIADVLDFSANPIANIRGSLLQHVDIPELRRSAMRYANETDEHYRHRMMRKYLGMLPYVGGIISEVTKKHMPEYFRNVFNMNDVYSELTPEAQVHWHKYVEDSFSKYKIDRSPLKGGGYLTAEQFQRVVAMDQQSADAWISEHLKYNNGKVYVTSIRDKIRRYMDENQIHPWYNATLGTLFGEVWTSKERFPETEWERNENSWRGYKAKPLSWFREKYGSDRFSKYNKFKSYKNKHRAYRNWNSYSPSYKKRRSYGYKPKLRKAWSHNTWFNKTYSQGWINNPYPRKVYRQYNSWYNYNNRKIFWKNRYTPYNKYTYKMFKNSRYIVNKSKRLVSSVLRRSSTRIWRKLFTRSMRLRGHLENLPYNKWTRDMHFGLMRYKMRVAFRP